MSIPKVFISYSHDTIQHKQWVLELATRMRNNGIDAIIDQWELKPGDDLPHFMETYLTSADKVIMVCTENYVTKANAGAGGVGYEKMIITSSLLSRINENKVIPVIRQTSTKDTPTFLKSKLFIDFSKDDQHEFSFDELIRTIHGSPLYKKPEIGNNPFKEVDKIQIEENHEATHTIMKIICNIYNNGDLNYVRYEDVRNSTIISKIYLEFILKKLASISYIKQDEDNDIYLTDKGRVYAINNNIA